MRMLFDIVAALFSFALCVAGGLIFFGLMLRMAHEPWMQGGLGFLIVAACFGLLMLLGGLRAKLFDKIFGSTSVDKELN